MSETKLSRTIVKIIPILFFMLILFGYHLVQFRNVFFRNLSLIQDVKRLDINSQLQLIVLNKDKNAYANPKDQYTFQCGAEYSLNENSELISLNEKKYLAIPMKVLLAQAYQKHGMQSNAAKILKEVVIERPTDWISWLRLGDSLVCLGMYRDALFAYDHIPSDYDIRNLTRSRLYTMLAEIEIRNDDPSTAVRELSYAMRFDPENLVAIYRCYELGDKCNFSDHNDLLNVLNTFQLDSVDKSNEITDLPFVGKIIPMLVNERIWHMNVAKSLISFWIEDENFYDAEFAIQGLLSLGKNNDPELNQLLAETFIGLGRYEDSIKILFDQAQKGDIQSAKILGKAFEDYADHFNTNEKKREYLNSAYNWYKKYYSSRPSDLIALVNVIRVCNDLKKNNCDRYVADNSTYYVHKITDSDINQEDASSNISEIPTNIKTWNLVRWDTTACKKCSQGFFTLTKSFDSPEGDSVCVRGIWGQAENNRTLAAGLLYSKKLEFQPGKEYILSFIYNLEGTSVKTNALKVFIGSITSDMDPFWTPLNETRGEWHYIEIPFVYKGKTIVYDRPLFQLSDVPAIFCMSDINIEELSNAEH